MHIEAIPSNTRRRVSLNAERGSALEKVALLQQENAGEPQGC